MLIHIWTLVLMVGPSKPHLGLCAALGPGLPTGSDPARGPRLKALDRASVWDQSLVESGPSLHQKGKVCRADSWSQATTTAACPPPRSCALAAEEKAANGTACSPELLGQRIFALDCHMTAGWVFSTLCGGWEGKGGGRRWEQADFRRGCLFQLCGAKPDAVRTVLD